MSSEEKEARLKAQWLAASKADLDEMLAECESPIERLFMLGMLVGDGQPGTSVFALNHFALEDYDAVRSKIAWTRGAVVGGSQRYAVLTVARPGLLLIAQPVLVVGDRRCRLDFAIVGEWAKIAIELDGHAFHELTKEQAARDKSRDRALSTAGWTVLRFTGSEIYASPSGCADQVDDLLLERARVANGALT